MPKGYGNQTVAAIDPSRTGYCHPAQAKRTKCACGKTIALARGGGAGIRCDCGRVHYKRPGSSFGGNHRQPVRPGGRAGCPGVPAEALHIGTE